jgi:predicted CoA-binding protein
VIAVTLEQAKTIAVVGTTALIVGAIASFWVMKSLVQKLIVASLLALLAFAVWTQRGALQDCADKVQQSYQRSGTDVAVSDTECSFFGISITISDPRPG